MIDRGLICKIKIMKLPTDNVIIIEIYIESYTRIMNANIIYDRDIFKIYIKYFCVLFINGKFYHQSS